MLATIERILHQTWKTKELPENYSYWNQTFLEHNPKIDYRFYDDGMNRQLLSSIFPNLIPLYDSFPREIFRVDFIRPVYLFEFGGIYADLDFQCLLPFDPFFEQFDGVLLGKMGTREEFPHSIPNALMMSSSRQAFWLGYLANIEKTWLGRPPNTSASPDVLTGPVVLRKTVIEYQRDRNSFSTVVAKFVSKHSLDVDFKDVRWGWVGLAPSHIWYPLDWTDQVHLQYRRTLYEGNILLSTNEARKMFPNSFAVTYWTHSW